MPKPLTEDERTRIVNLLTEGKSYREIAQNIGRSHGAIGKIARSIGHRSGRTNLARARDAKSAFCAERRALAAARAQERLEELLEGMGADQPVIVQTPKGPVRLDVPPDARAQRDRASAAATLNRLVLDTDRHDNQAGIGMSQLEAFARSLFSGDG